MTETEPTQHEVTGKIIPNELDILCGKTKQIISHPGTIRYQRIVESFTQSYIQAESKYEKMTVTKSLFDTLRQTSRFLRYNDTKQTWEEIGALAARDKVGHALRFAVNNLNIDKNKKQKRAKNKRGHRRAGSDFSAEASSLTSITSERSINTIASAASDGLTMKSVMQNIAANFSIAQIQKPPIDATKLASSDPLRASSIPQRSHEHSLKNPTAISQLPPSGFAFNPGVDVGKPAFSRWASTSSDSSLFGFSGNDSGLFCTSSKHSSDSELYVKPRPQVAPCWDHQAPPTEVATTTKAEDGHDGEMSQNLLSILNEPIYEFEAERTESNDDL